MINLYTVPQLDGVGPTFAAPAASEKATVGSILVVKNASAASINVTLVTPGNLATGDAFPDKVYAVPAGGERWIPVLPSYRGADGYADLTFSAVASVTATSVRPSVYAYA